MQVLGGLPRLLLSTRLVLVGNRRLFARCGFVETAQLAHPGYAHPTFVDLEKALAGYDASFTGRKAFQAATRANLPRFEVDTSDAQGRLKINPLIDWDAGQIEGYFIQHDLPRHPLIAQGYPSIGCSPCTSQVAPGEDPRSGRWKGWDKTECGIHKPGEEPFL